MGMTDSLGTTVGGTTDTAKEQAGRVGQVATEGASQVAQTTKEQAGEVAAETGRQVRQLAGEFRSQLDEQAGSQRDRLVETLRSVGDEMRQMAESSDQSGVAADLVRQVSDRADSAASFLDGREPSDLLNEVRYYARRRPGMFLLAAGLAGAVAGRITRGAVSSARSDDSSEWDYATTETPVSGFADVTPDPYPTAPTGLSGAGVGVGAGVGAGVGGGMADPLAPTATDPGLGADPLAAPDPLRGSDPLAPEREGYGR